MAQAPACKGSIRLPPENGEGLRPAKVPMREIQSPEKGSGLQRFRCGRFNLLKKVPASGKACLPKMAKGSGLQRFRCRRFNLLKKVPASGKACLPKMAKDSGLQRFRCGRFNLLKKVPASGKACLPKMAKGSGLQRFPCGRFNLLKKVPASGKACLPKTAKGSGLQRFRCGRFNLLKKVPASGKACLLKMAKGSGLQRFRCGRFNLLKKVPACIGRLASFSLQRFQCGRGACRTARMTSLGRGWTWCLAWVAVIRGLGSRGCENTLLELRRPEWNLLFETGPTDFISIYTMVVHHLSKWRPTTWSQGFLGELEEIQ